MIKLRWYGQVKRVSAAMVRTYAEDHDMSYQEAKYELVGDSRPLVLQQWDEANGTWVDVPQVVDSIEVEIK